MKDKFFRTKKFVQDHKSSLIAFTGFAVGTTVMYRYAKQADPYISLKVLPEELKWMQETKSTMLLDTPSGTGSFYIAPFKDPHL
jgi:hypothetical protein